MASLSALVVFLVTAFFSTVSGKVCVYHHVFGNDTYVSCSEGCCHRWISPCCQRDTYSSHPFFASSVFRVVTFCCIFIAILVAILIYRRRSMMRRLQRAQARRNRVNAARTNHGASVISNGDLSLDYESVGYDHTFNSMSFRFQDGAVLPPAYDTLPPAYTSLPPPYKINKGLDVDSETSGSIDDNNNNNNNNNSSNNNISNISDTNSNQDETQSSQRRETQNADQ